MLWHDETLRHLSKYWPGRTKRQVRQTAPGMSRRQKDFFGKGQALFGGLAKKYLFDFSMNETQDKS
jgi:hypothetical protein